MIRSRVQCGPVESGIVGHGEVRSGSAWSGQAGLSLVMFGIAGNSGGDPLSAIFEIFILLCVLTRYNAVR